jgi:MerR family mercuric resistance operon transcriptional regulator
MMIDSEKSDAPGGKQEVPLDDHGKQPGLGDAPLSIGNVSNMFNVSRIRLLFYERLGVMPRRRRIGQHLVYRSIDCDRLAFIIKARRLGLTARQVAPIINATESGATVESIRNARATCIELIDQLDCRRRDLRDALAEFRNLYWLMSTRLSQLDAYIAPGDTQRKQ